MKALQSLATTVLICAALAYGQSTAPAAPPANPPGQSAPGAPSPQPHPGPHAGKGMGDEQMHQQHMQELKASLAQMHALLNSMRAGYSSMDVKDQPAMQANIEMWQFVLDHLDEVARHMESMHGGMGAGGTMHHRVVTGPNRPAASPEDKGQQEPPPTAPPK